MQRMHWHSMWLGAMLAMTGGCRIGAFELTDGYVLRGVAAGLLMPVTLELETSRGIESLTVSKDGPFEFQKFFFNDKDGFDVSIVGGPPCQVEGGKGEIQGANATVQLHCMLTSLRLSGPSDELDLSAAQTEYTVPVSVLQQSASVIAVAAVPDVEIEVAGATVASGMPSEPVALSLGDNRIVVTVRHSPSGWMQTYGLTVTRGKGIVQGAYGKASNTGASDDFGISVALSGDTLAVGAWQEDSSATGIDGDQMNNSVSDSGAVYVFRRLGAVWQQEAYVKASNTGLSDRFGWSVALSGDTLAVGARGESSNATGINQGQGDNSATGSGAVYVFRRTGSSWGQEAYVKASNTGAGDSFGWNVALSGDTLAVGAIGEDSNATGATQGQNQADNSAAGSGAVYVFRRTGTIWQQEAYVKAFNTDTTDNFGVSVSLSGDILAVGALFEDSNATGIDNGETSNSGTDSGAVYVYRRTGSVWQRDAYIKASNTGLSDNFGVSVSLSGNTLAVGAYKEDSSNVESDNSADDSGAVYVFQKTGSTWQQEAYVKASNIDAGDEFGYSVAVSGDILAVGSFGEASVATGIDGDQTSNAASFSGAVYVFRRADAVWQQAAYIKASNAAGGDNLGNSVALTGDTLVIGASSEDSGASGIDGDGSDDSLQSSGAVYIFH